MTTAETTESDTNETDQHEIVISRTVEPLDEEPDPLQIADWLSHVLVKLVPDQSTQTSIQIVSTQEMAALNQQYRGFDQPTNVLSFVSDTPLEDGRILLGDLAVCSAIIEREAQTYGKPFRERYAHIMIHGLLHLLGFDHVETQDQSRMEAMEKQLLAELGIHDPYVMEANA